MQRRHLKAFRWLSGTSQNPNQPADESRSDSCASVQMLKYYAIACLHATLSTKSQVIFFRCERCQNPRTVYCFRFLNGFLVYNCVCMYCFVVLVLVVPAGKLIYNTTMTVRATDGTPRKERECESSDGKGNRK